MRQLLLASLFIAAAPVHAAYADTAMPNVDIISVVPRSPDVKPYLMSLPAEGRPEHAAVAQKPGSPQPANVTPDRKPPPTTLARE